MIDPTSQSQEQFYIQAISSIAEVLPHVLKHGDSFAIIDRRGNMRPLGVQNHGLFRDGTRFLSRLMLRVGGRLPLLLSSEVGEDADFVSVDLTNPRLETESGTPIPQDTIHLRQKLLLWHNTLYMQLVVYNYGTDPAAFPLTLEFDADYIDIFEVRGLTRKRHGDLHAPHAADAQVRLAYTGLDEIERRTHLAFSVRPDEIAGDQAVFHLHLEPHQQREIVLAVACRYTDEAEQILDFDEAARHLRQSVDRQHAICRVETSNEGFNDWLNASRRDLFMLLTETPTGLYPYAGVPWYSTVFGRDGIITALQTLWFYPEIARGVLRTLAAHQATEVDPARDAEPGKIVHEERPGEMANTGEIPFSRYYGTIDATPLFILLAGRYYQRTADLALIRELWGSIAAALEWIDRYGDIDGDGFVEYQRKNETGILQQGWKDSNDSVFHADGTLVRPPVALCEVQGYVYEARLLAAEMAEALGQPDVARTQREQAGALRQRFLQAFWLEELGTYAIALDGDKQPCRVRSSNAGHCLYTGIADPAHAERITRQFLSGAFFAGWGIRTIAAGEARYNPMSYHNGSIWPHDNSLIAAGMARYGFKEAASKVLSALFDASLFMDLNRLPELFCGFERRHREGPTSYPVACLPQAWAAASVYLMLQACLGLRVDGVARRIYFDSPVLPAGLNHVHILNLPIADTTLDLTLHRTGDDVSLSVAGRTGDIEVIVTRQ